MCTETYTRYLRCTHTQLRHWKYCAILIPTERIPSTGRACRKYKSNHKDVYNNDSCFKCLCERAIAEATGAVLHDQWGVERLPPRGVFARNDTFSTFAGSTTRGSALTVGKRGSKDSEQSSAQSDEPRSPVKMSWERDEEGDGQEEEKKGRKGIKGWFKDMVQGSKIDRAEAEAMAFLVQKMDA